MEGSGGRGGRPIREGGVHGSDEESAAGSLISKAQMNMYFLLFFFELLGWDCIIQDFSMKGRPFLYFILEFGFWLTIMSRVGNLKDGECPTSVWSLERSKKRDIGPFSLSLDLVRSRHYAKNKFTKLN